MNRIIIMCLLAVISLPTWSLAGAIGPARISYVDGDILFRSPDDEEWLPATINTPLDEGDAVWCPDDSRAEIQLPDGTVVRLDGGSQLDLLANEDGFVHLHLASGYLYLRTTPTTAENSLQIDADDTTVLPSAQTLLRIDMLPNSLEDVAITSGSAYVEGGGDRTSVRGGEHILLEEGHSEVLPLNPADSWELWNVDRDREQSRLARADSYLPDELQGYSAELDAHGTWESVPEYGRVWRPSVVVSDDWAPYRDGRWVWRGDDYVWLSFESWGWVPYHFGRWAVVRGFGWCWVPPVRGDVYWGPGYVGWYRTGSHVGWTPLAPGEVFYGRRNYGRHSVNITSVNINNSNVVYRNRTSRGGLTVLPQSDFLRGRTAIQQPARNSSVSVSVSVGSPRIKPLRETRMPIVKQTPPRFAPPRIEHRDSRELRSRFPRVAPAPAAERRRQQPAPAAAVPGRQPQIREKKTVFPVVAPAERTPNKDRQQPQTTQPQREERRQRPTPPTPPPAVSQPAQPAPPVAKPQQPARQQREERRQRPTPPSAVSQPTQPTQPAPPAEKPQQPGRQQRDERRQPSTPPQAVPQPAQPAPPVAKPQQPARQQRDERRQGDRPPQAATPSPQTLPPVSGQTPQRSEQPRRVTVPADSQNRPEAAPSRGTGKPATKAAPAAPQPQPANPPRVEVPRGKPGPKEPQQKKVWKVTTPESDSEKDSREKNKRDKEPRDK